MLKNEFAQHPFSSLVKAPSSNPSKLIFDIVTGIASDQDCLIEKMSSVSSGGLQKSVDWLYQIQDGNFFCILG